MIDDVTVVARLAEPVAIQAPTIPRLRTDLSGTTVTWRVASGQGLTVAVCEATNDIEVRLSFPRLANGYPCNFPLCPARSVDMTKVMRQVSQLLGCDTFPGDADGLLVWGVRRVAFAMDIPTDGAPRVLEALSARPRRGNPPQRWGHPCHAVQWDGENVRVQLYRKRDEILNRIRQLRRQQAHFQRASIDLRRHLADQAANMVRLEVTLKNSKAMRSLLGVPSGSLPTLRVILDEEVGAFVVGREVRKLKLVSAAGEGAATVGGVDVLALAGSLGQAARRTVGGRRGGVLRGTRLLAAGFLHQLHGLTDAAEVQAMLGLTARAYADLRRDLVRIGMPPLGTSDPSGHGYVDRFAESVHDQVVEFPLWIEGPLGDDAIVRAPWADRGAIGEVAEFEEFFVDPMPSKREHTECDDVELLEQGALAGYDDDGDDSAYGNARTLRPDEVDQEYDYSEYQREEGSEPENEEREDDT